VKGRKKGKKNEESNTEGKKKNNVKLIH